MIDILDKKIFKTVSEIADSEGSKAFVIGGYVRDYFLGRPSNDIDIVVEGSGIEIAEKVGQEAQEKNRTGPIPASR